MPSGKGIVAVILAVTIGVILLSPMATTVADNTGTQTVTNETVTADYNNSVQLDGWDLVSGTVTVYGYNETSGSYEQASSPGDYSVQLEPGKLDVNSSSTLIDDGEDVKVSYDYEATNQTQTLVAGFIVTLTLTLLLGVLGMEVADRV